jgi:hypothetical protein
MPWRRQMANLLALSIEWQDIYVVVLGAFSIVLFLHLMHILKG